jgi:biopolymer transport protein ExbD
MLKRPPRATTIGLNLAPMVDVMMCLLIFFMLATKMVERENSAIDLPLALAAKDAEKRELGNRFVVNVRQTGDDGEGAEYLVREEVVPLVTLYERLKVEGQHDANVNCVIRAERHVPYRHVEAVLLGCSHARIRNITFSALQGEGGE